MSNTILSFGPARYAVAMLLLAALSFGCGKSETTTTSTDSTHSTAKVAVQATQVITGNVPEQLVVTGHTEATRQEKIVAPIAGKLLELNGIEGSYINAGDLVASIQSKEAEASQDGAQVMLAEAKTPAERAQAEHMVALAKKAQNGMRVRSTISGLVATRSANPGEFVAEDQELLSIVQMSDILFVADVPLFDMPHIRIGEPATITLPTLGETSAPVAARVFAIKPGVDSSGQTAQVLFQFQHLPEWLIHALRTGIIGTATITFDVLHNVMLVPKSALLRNDETNARTVVTFGSDSLAKSIEVTAGPEIDSFVSVWSDTLRPGMNVITVGNYALADSTRITLAPTPTLGGSVPPTGNPAPNRAAGKAATPGQTGPNTPSPSAAPGHAGTHMGAPRGVPPSQVSSPPNGIAPSRAPIPRTATPPNPNQTHAPHPAPAQPNVHARESAPGTTPGGNLK